MDADGEGEYADFPQITHNRSCPEVIISRATVEQLGLELLWPSRSVWLLGAAPSNFDAAIGSAARQLALMLK